MVMRRVSTRGAVWGLLLFAWVLPALGRAGGLSAPEQVIQETSDQLQRLVHSERARLKKDPGYVFAKANEIVGPRVDFSVVSRLVVGRHWSRATAQQKAAFSKEFEHLLVRTYAKAFLDFASWDVHFAPLKLSQADRDIVVRTEVSHPSGPPIHVDYRMRRDAQGWKAYDVVIEGVSLVVNYRNQFRDILRAQGLDALIHKLTVLNQQRSGSAAREGEEGWTAVRRKPA